MADKPRPTWYTSTTGQNKWQQPTSVHLLPLPDAAHIRFTGRALEGTHIGRGLRDKRRANVTSRNGRSAPKTNVTGQVGLRDRREVYVTGSSGRPMPQTRMASRADQRDRREIDVTSPTMFKRLLPKSGRQPWHFKPNFWKRPPCSIQYEINRVGVGGFVNLQRAM